MTMPTTAMLIERLSGNGGILPSEMSDSQLVDVITTLKEDLPGDPIGFIELVAPESHRCSCGAIHLALDDSRLDTDTKSSLLRLLATPFGDYVREHFRRTSGYQNIRFGWDGIQQVAPAFTRMVDEFDARTVNASTIPHNHLQAIIDAIGEDMPAIMPFIHEALESGASIAIPPQPGPAGRQHWQEQIHQLMFIFATPLRKYVQEWAGREYNRPIGAVNCCFIPVGAEGEEGASWVRSQLATQIAQQITPDC